MTDTSDNVATFKSSPIQEIIQRYAMGTMQTIEQTLVHTHGLEISKTLFQLRSATCELVEQMHRKALPIRTLDAISVELLNTIQVCVNASILGRGRIETKQ